MTNPILLKTGAALKGSWKIFKFLLTIILSISIFSTAAFIAIYLFFARDLPDIKTLADYNPPVISEVYANDGTKIGEFWNECRIFKPFNDIPKRVVQAFVDSEDERFFDHQGVDMRSIFRAFVTNMKEGSIKQGGSTITQQVTRALLLTREKSLDRKAKEAILATRIERYLNKQQILTLYLNQIYLGNRAYGVAAAARNYFKKDLNELTLGQIALLGGLPTAPTNYSPINNPTEARNRQLHVLGRMVAAGHITKEEARAAQDEKFTIYVAGIDKDFNDKDAAYFIEHVRRRVKERFGDEGIYNAGLKIYTTVDMKMQKAAVAALKRGLEGMDRKLGFRGPIDHVQPEQIAERAIQYEKQLLAKQYGNEIAWPVSATPEPRTIDFQVGETYNAIVTDFRDKETFVQIGNISGVIKLENLKWARRHQPGTIGYEGAAYVSDPRTILKIGDVILVRRLEDGTFALAQEPVIQGALISMDTHDKFIKAMVGGYDFAKSEFNRVNQALRQPGSSFKPFVYSAGLDKGYTMSTVVVDGPVTFPAGKNETWTPKNYGGNYMGAIPYKTCIQMSRNIPTAKITFDIGTHYLTAFERKMGITTPIEKYLSMALGANAVFLQEMVQAYTVFADQGIFKPAIAITKIEDARGNVVESIDTDAQETTKAEEELVASLPEKVGKAVDINDLNKELYADNKKAIETDKLNLTDLEIKTLYGTSIPENHVITPQTAYLMTTMLKGVVEGGTATRVKALGKPAAGKTGTTNDETDAWFIGFVPDLAAGVWIGFDEVQKIGPGVTGGQVAAPIFVDYMKVATENMEAKDFPKPEGFPTGDIADLTGGSSLFGSAPKQTIPGVGGGSHDSGDRAGTFFQEDFESFSR